MVISALKRQVLGVNADLSDLALTVTSLSPKQQALALSTKGLTQTQIDQVMASNGVAEAERRQALAALSNKAARESLTVAMAQDILMSRGLTAEKAKEVLMAAKVDVADKQAIINKRNLSKQLLINKLIQEGYTSAEIKGITASLGLNTATNTLTAGVKGLWATIVANPIGLILTAVSLVVSGVQKFIQAQKEAREAAIEAAEAAKQEAEEIRDLYKQYVDATKAYENGTSSKSDYIEVTNNLLEKLGIEKSEVKELVEQYGDLNSAINAVTLDALKQQVGSLNNAANAKRQDFIDVFKNNGKSIFGLINSKGTVDLLSYQKDLFALIDEVDASLINKINSLEYTPFLGDKAEEYAKDYLSTVKELIENIESRYSTDELLDNDFYIDLVTIRDNLTEGYEAYNSAIKEINQNAAEMVVKNALIGREIPKTKEEFDKFYQSIIKASVEGDNWQNGFTGGAEEAKKAIENALRSMPEFAEFFADDIPTSANKSSLSLKSTTHTIEDLQEAMEKVISTSDKFADALEKIAQKDTFTLDDVLEFAAIDPSLMDAFTLTVDGYVADFDRLSQAYKRYLIEQSENAKTELKNNKADIAVLEEKIAELKGKRDQLANSGTNIVVTDAEGNITGDTKSRIADINKEIDSLNATLDKTNQQLAQNQVLVDWYENQSFAAELQALKSGFEDVKDEVDDYNSEIGLLQDTIDKMTEGTALSRGELVKLIEAFPALDGKYRETSDGIYIEIDALEDLKKQSYETKDSYINSQIEQTEAIRKNVEFRLNYIKSELHLMEVLPSMYHYTEEKAKEYQAEIDALSAQLDDINGFIAYLKASAGEVFSTDSSKDVTNALQDQIDYYDTLLNAIGAVTDKQIEALEDEKDALEKQKDALKDANDERQRELDLIEARNNLENAKKRKVYVYTEGSGFKQTQDKKAVKEAEEKLNDVLVDIQEAEYDKQIAKLNEQISAFEDYKKQFSDMKSDIEELIDIEKAKNALDLDEKGLLNLPADKAKEIQEGLANAVLEKDKEDNKENEQYKKFGNITADEFLKRLGSPLSFEEFSKKWNTNMTTPSIADYAAQSSGVVNNSEVFNNNSKKEINFAPNITVNGVNDPEAVRCAVRDEITEIARQFRDSVI